MSPTRPVTAVIRTITLTAIAATVALAPATGWAEPTDSDRLDAIIAEHEAAEDLLADLEDQLAEAEEEATDATPDVAIAPETVTDATRAVPRDESPLARLSAVTLYGVATSEQLADAVTAQDTAATLLAELRADVKAQRAAVKELAVQRDELAADLASSPAPVGTTSTTVSADGAGAVAFAVSQLGDPYVYGAAGPDGWDCSGLTSAAWAAAGGSLSHSTYAQWDETARIGADELRPGDLVFYNGLGHVAIYAGDGQVIHAPTTGDVVRYAPIDMMAIEGYGRL
ncbi:C40 family peptidase [Stackebrandtia soli]|uniref:C40 family peptidase n=1 Tax=Stackebrandtia soli TaxID=1892856 RepID=UPI0039EB0C35